MPNMRMTKNPMPSQDPNVRNKNFKEVTLGYTEEMALDEAQRISGYCAVLFPAGCLRPCLPAGDAVRRQVRARH